MDWTNEAIEQLKTLWAQGHSTAEIGRRMGISKNAVVGKAHRLSLPARPSPIKREEATTRAPAPRRVNGSTLPPLPVHDAAPSAAPAAKIISVQAAAAGQPCQAPTVATPVLAVAGKSSVQTKAVQHMAPLLKPVAAKPTRQFACCCWPIGEPGTPEFHFCDADAVHGKPYCTEHAQLAYVRVRDRREDAA